MEGTDMTGWRKSTYSGGANGSCVEVKSVTAVLVRDTTNRAGGAIEFSAAAWGTFIDAVK